MGGEWRRFAVGFGVAAVVGLALTVLDPLGRRKITPAQLEAQAEKDPAFARYVVAFRESFPAEYRAMLATGAANANAGLPVEQAQAAAFGQVNALVRRHRAALARAPDAELDAHARAQHVLMAVLDEPVCARFFMRGFGPADRVENRAKLAVADLTSATLRAERAGLDRPVARPAPLSDRDADALLGAMRAQGMTRTQQALFTGGGLEDASVADQCAVGRQLAGAVDAMPAAQGARLWSFVLSQS